MVLRVHTVPCRLRARKSPTSRPPHSTRLPPLSPSPPERGRHTRGAGVAERVVGETQKAGPLQLRPLRPAPPATMAAAAVEVAAAPAEAAPARPAEAASGAWAAGARVRGCTTAQARDHPWIFPLGAQAPPSSGSRRRRARSAARKFPSGTACSWCTTGSARTSSGWWCVRGARGVGPRRRFGRAVTNGAALLPLPLLARQKAARALRVDSEQWKFVNFFRYYNEVFCVVLHDHHEIEETIFVPAINRHGNVVPEKIAEDHGCVHGLDGRACSGGTERGDAGSLDGRVRGRSDDRVRRDLMARTADIGDRLRILAVSTPATRTPEQIDELARYVAGWLRGRRANPSRPTDPSFDPELPSRAGASRPSRRTCWSTSRKRRRSCPRWRAGT